MNLYKIGKVASVGKAYIILETNYTGSIVYVANPNEWEKSKNYKVFIYDYKNEYMESTYGFKSFSERILFEDLISINGIGPKTALNFLKKDFETLITLISTGDKESIAKIPYVGMKTATQIVLALKEKYKIYCQKHKIILENREWKHHKFDLHKPLKTLGFNKEQIEYAIKNVPSTSTIEKMVEDAIKIISKQHA